MVTKSFTVQCFFMLNDAMMDFMRKDKVGDSSLVRYQYVNYSNLTAALNFNFVSHINCWFSAATNCRLRDNALVHFLSTRQSVQH